MAISRHLMALGIKTTDMTGRPEEAPALCLVTIAVRT